MMDLLDRYLHAIRRNLPAARAEDITAELGGDLIARKEDREAALGHPLDTAETSALIKQFGHPLIVASRYRQHQYLIGPEVFPFYWFVLRIVLLVVVAVLAGLAVLHVALGDMQAGPALIEALGRIAPALLLNAAVVTLVFAVLDRSGFPRDHIRDWNPKSLPEVRDKRPGPWAAAIEVALTIAVLLWWSGMVRIPFAFGHAPGFRIELAPIWGQLYWPILALLVLRLAHNLIQWLRPRWTALRWGLGAVSFAGGMVVLGLALRAGQWAAVVPTGMSADSAVELQNSLNLSLRIAIIAAGAIWTVQCLAALWRLARRRIERTG